MQNFLMKSTIAEHHQDVDASEVVSLWKCFSRYRHWVFFIVFQCSPNSQTNPHSNKKPLTEQGLGLKGSVATFH